MANIIPAILTDNIREIQDKLDKLAEVIEFVQIDFMDGKFVDNVSVKPEELRQLETDINLEAHLMVRNPDQWLPHLSPDVFKHIYFHIEAVPEPEDLIRQIKGIGHEVGIALNLETSSEIIEPYTEYLEAVLFMSIAKPGWQGEQFHPEVLEKIKEFWKEYPDINTGIDGGVDENNIAEISEAGVHNIYVGSALFAQGNVKDNLEKLKDKLR